MASFTSAQLVIDALITYAGAGFFAYCICRWKRIPHKKRLTLLVAFLGLLSLPIIALLPGKPADAVSGDSTP